MRRDVFSLSLLLLAAPMAMADCVNFSAARAKAAQAALMKKPPTASDIGLPTLEGLTLVAERTAGDPQCDGPPPYKRYAYSSKGNYFDLVSRFHPNIRRRTSQDGMNRIWFANPKSGDKFVLTSGTEITVIGLNAATGEFAFITASLPAVMQPLTNETQPYSAKDIADGTPWPGGAGGKREFLRADGPSTANAPAAPGSAAAPDVPQPVTGSASAESAPAPAPAPRENATTDVIKNIPGQAGSILRGIFGR